MSQQNQNRKAPLRETIGKKRRSLALLFLLLLILALSSSVMVGFLIGRNTGIYRGQILDTILLGPDQNRPLHVAGQVLYTDGTPYANGQVELRSEPRLTMTDNYGRFFYESAQPGTHTLSVLDRDGKALATCEFTISRNADGQPINIQKQADGKYAVELSVNVRFVELAVELDESGAVLALLPEKTTALEDDGTLVVGERKMSVEDGAVALPSGTVVLPDKTVMVPGNLILPDNTVTSIPKDGYQGENGEKVEENGTVTLPDGTEITPGEVKAADGSVVRLEEPYQIPSSPKPSISDLAGSSETPAKSSGNPGGYSPKPEETQPEAPSGSGGSGETSPATQPDESQTMVPLKPGDPGETSPDAPPPESSRPEESGILGVYGENAGGWTLWESQSNIDLFYNRTGGPADKIQPGSSGFYRFRLKNTWQTALKITITLSEDRLHIPLKFTLTPLNADESKAGDGVTGFLAYDTLVLGGSIEARAETAYQLDWEWPAEGNDEADTAAGAAGGDYIVNVRILATGD